MMNEGGGEAASSSASEAAPVAEETGAEAEEEAEETEAPWLRDDELIVKYLKHWIPQFTDIFQNTLYTRCV